jgi:FkbM family methyltransferase
MSKLRQTRLNERRANTMNVLELQIADGLKLAVPASLECITTYVLLEQESWFEKEVAFVSRWLRPGMMAIDIGANIGYYAAIMAHRVGPRGRVFAYEPAREPRALLEHNRALNDLSQLEVLAVALSDRVGQGRLMIGESSELNALGSGERGDEVSVTTLDLEQAKHGWVKPDFVKMDVEGEEERIVAGGGHFFAAHCPLVMFETKVGTSLNEPLRAAFRARGYRLYRQLGGAPILVGAEGDALDGFELNAFAAKPKRAAALEAEGWLVDPIAEWAPDGTALRRGLTAFRDQKFAPALRRQLGKDTAIDVDYRAALAGYAAWRTPDLPAAERCAALAFALRLLRDLCARAPTAERLSTLTRVAADWGARTESVAVARRIAEMISRGPLQVREPFWPASSRFDDVAPKGPLDVWLFGAAAEHIERANHYSSLYTGATATLNLVVGLPNAPIEMERRRVLTASLAGLRPKVPQCLCVNAPGHLNAEVWRSGAVPGTMR